MGKEWKNEDGGRKDGEDRDEFGWVLGIGVGLDEEGGEERGDWEWVEGGVSGNEREEEDRGWVVLGDKGGMGD